MTPLDKTGLYRQESDQEHLEFQHPYFVREHPELLQQIRRKTAATPITSRSDAAFLAAAAELGSITASSGNSNDMHSKLL